MASSGMLPPPNPLAARYSVEEWEMQKPRIHNLYVKDGYKLKELMQILEESGFVATEKQFKSRITKWGFDTKNVKGDVMIDMARTQAKRRHLESKESAFRVNKKPVEPSKINRYLRRNDISDEHLLSMPSPVSAPSPAFSVFTPSPALETGAESPAPVEGTSEELQETTDIPFESTDPDASALRTPLSATQAQNSSELVPVKLPYSGAVIKVALGPPWTGNQEADAGDNLQNYMINQTSGNHLLLLDELMLLFDKQLPETITAASVSTYPILKSIWPLIGRSVDLCCQARNGRTPQMTSQARALQALLLTGDASVTTDLFPDLSSSPRNDPAAGAMAELYRYATLVLLCQAFPESPIDHYDHMALKDPLRVRYLGSLCACFGALRALPPQHQGGNAFLYPYLPVPLLFPLLVASCEARQKGDREWYQAQWQRLLAHSIWVSSIGKCWEATQVVWRRRDSVVSVPAAWLPPRDLEGDGWYGIPFSELHANVDGRLHWAGVMRDLKLF